MYKNLPPSTPTWKRLVGPALWEEAMNLEYGEELTIAYPREHLESAKFQWYRSFQKTGFKGTFSISMNYQTSTLTIISLGIKVEEPSFNEPFSPPLGARLSPISLPSPPQEPPKQPPMDLGKPSSSRKVLIMAVEGALSNIRESMGRDGLSLEEALSLQLSRMPSEALEAKEIVSLEAHSPSFLSQAKPLSLPSRSAFDLLDRTSPTPTPKTKEDLEEDLDQDLSFVETLD